MEPKRLAQSIVDALTPGNETEVSTDDALLLGAFTEDALSAEDAHEAAVKAPQE